MDLEIKEEKYKIKVGQEVYSVDFPSFEEAQEIEKALKDTKENPDSIIVLVKDWLVKLGLDAKFFGLKMVKAHHIMKVWREINTVKK